MIPMFAALVVTHAICDYPLQGDFLARAKNHRAPIEGVEWWVALFMHAAIHAGGVWLVTGNSSIAVAELLLHMLIDFGKCDGRFSFADDQLMHLGCKASWAVIATGGFA